ncbi:hypothetical protein DUE52_03040 [Larkinella punicea]|uniref:Uncharacterized protein n=1 Tax=Larkinella punicea TaxID=2315727 RepID=A0A368JU92_9BACT|nr:hypothetical protein DUE52_03040 [Larkinella punicea]
MFFYYVNVMLPNVQSDILRIRTTAARKGAQLGHRKSAYDEGLPVRRHLKDTLSHWNQAYKSLDKNELLTSKPYVNLPKLRTLPEVDKWIVIFFGDRQKSHFQF